MANPQEVSFFNDLPTLEDKLSWKAEIAHFRQRIMACEPPHIFGIHGDWGTGKTSFMRQLQYALGGNPPHEDGSVAKSGQTNSLEPEHKESGQHVVTVWFDAWRYQNEAVPVVALLQEMRRQFTLIPDLQERLKKFGSVAGNYLLNALGDIAKLIGSENITNAEKIQKAGEKWEADNYCASLPHDSIRKLLHETIKTLLPESNESRVVVFIDDLDRCNHEAAYRLLEGLKIYLNIPKCIFIIGMNEQVMIDAIGKVLPLPKDAGVGLIRMRAAHYLEKICSDIWRLPLLSKPIDVFIQWIENTEQRQALVEVVGQSKCLPPNPRRLKSLVNQWLRFSHKLSAAEGWPSDKKGQQLHVLRVLIVAYIFQFHRDIWDRWCFQPDFFGQIKKWCMNQLAEADAKNFFPELRFPEKTSTGETTGTEQTWETSFPDPHAIELFWISPLLRHPEFELKPNRFFALLECQRAE